MISSLTFCHPAIFAVFDCCYFFVINCKELKLAQTAQINQLFQFLKFICIYDHVFYVLPRMLMSKHVNSDVTMNPPMTKKVIKRKRYMLGGTVGKIISIETKRRTAHHVIESPIALGAQSLQLETERSWVPFLSILLCTQLYLIFVPFLLLLLCYVFKNSYFSCGLPINSFWFSGVSHEIKNYLILIC